MNYYNNLLIELFENEINNSDLSIFNETNNIFFQNLQQKFFFNGSKIDWLKTKNHCYLIPNSHHDIALEKLNFFKKIFVKHNLNISFLYSGDGEIDYVLKINRALPDDKLLELFEIPQHHYFTALDSAWCLCLSFEDDMDFAFSLVD